MRLALDIQDRRCHTAVFDTRLTDELYLSDFAGGHPLQEGDDFVLRHTLSSAIDVDRQLREAVELELIGTLYLETWDKHQPIKHTAATGFGEGSFTEDKGRPFVAYERCLPLDDDGLQFTSQLHGKSAYLKPTRRELQRRAKDNRLLEEGRSKTILTRRGLEQEIPLLIGKGRKGSVRSVGSTQYDKGIHQRSLVRLADKRPLQPSPVDALGTQDASEGNGEEDE